MSQTVTAKLAALNLTLPPAAAPVANYVPFLLSQDFLFISGQLSKTADGREVVGRLGQTLTTTDGQEAAVLCALNLLSQAQSAVGQLERIEKIVRITGFVNATPDFEEHPQVVNGASDLLANVLGEAGRHTRAAVGVSGLPAGCAVEIDAIIKIKTLS